MRLLLWPNGSLVWSFSPGSAERLSSVLEYLVFRVLALLAPRVPPWLGYWLCSAAGDAAYWLLPRRRANVRRNLSTILRGRTEGLALLAREVFREGARYYYDTFRAPALSDDELEREITLEGWENLQKGLQEGKGVLLVSAHLGSPALVVQILAVRHCKVTSVVERVRPQRLLDLMIRVRGCRGIRLIPFSSTIANTLAEALRRNEIVGLVVDRDTQRSGVPVEFFGAETTMPAGPVMIALRTGAALVPAFTYRRKGGGFVGRIEEPLELVRTGRLREELRANTQRLAAVLERAIAEAPEQWIVFEPVWPETTAEGRQGAAN